MDRETSHHASDTQRIEKMMCEKILRKLFRMKEKIDRPVIDFTEEEIIDLEEQVGKLLKEMKSLPIELVNEYTQSSEIVFQSLRKTIIKLNLALDQLSSSQDKAQFYTYLQASQIAFDTIFSSGLSETVTPIQLNAPLFLISSSPRKPLSNYKAMLDFSHDMLPGMYNLFKTTDTIWPEQCEQAIANMKKLEALFEKQKAALNVYAIPSSTSDEYATLHCKLNVALAHADELTQKLISLFSTLQSCGHSRSRKVQRTKEEIVYYLALFNHHYKTLLQKMQEIYGLKDQIRFLSVQH